MYPSKEELEGKWWHRLYKVLIWVPILLVVLLGTGVLAEEIGYHSVSFKEIIFEFLPFLFISTSAIFFFFWVIYNKILLYIFFGKVLTSEMRAFKDKGFIIFFILFLLGTALLFGEKAYEHTADKQPDPVTSPVIKEKPLEKKTERDKKAPFKIPGWELANQKNICSIIGKKELVTCNKMIRDLKSSIRQPFSAQADFNGDNLKDFAGLFINKKGERRVYVALNQRLYDPKIILLHDVGKLVGYYDLFVTLKEAGVYTDYTTNSGPKEKYSRLPGISFGLFEATETVFFWNNFTQKFDKENIAD